MASSNRARRIAFGVSLVSLGVVTPAFAQDRANDEIVVTAQRKEEALQDVPIAVSAFDAVALESKQIDTFSDLQFNTPNVYYTKTFFSGSNFQIRGIGVSSTAASSDTGVGIHVNDVFLQQPRLFETEYYDLERVEVLRGPQGTLYGRNATGGAVNMITKRPDLGVFGLDASYQLGNFNAQRLKGAINLPLGDTAALRFAGVALVRDGFTETADPNANFDSLDGRDQWSVRGSLRWEPTDDLRIDIIGSYFKEDDNRVRTPKTLCDTDPTGVLGCLPTGTGFGRGNFSATFGGIVLSNLTLGPLGLFPFNSVQNNVNPTDLRKAFVDENPQYTSDENFLMANVQLDLTDHLTLNVLGAYQDTSVASTQSGSPVVGGTIAIPALVAGLLPQNYARFFANGTIPVSALNPSHAGSIGGFIQRTTSGIFSSDQSDATSDQWSAEVRLSSNYDGPFNFQIAANYLDFSGAFNYYVFSSSLDYFAIVAPGATIPPAGFPDPQDGTGLITPYFGSETNPYGLVSKAIFGEGYYEATDKLKFTLGVRYTEDEKSVRDRSLPLISGTLVPTGSGAAAATTAYLNTAFDADSSTPGIQAFRNDSVTFSEATGRFVVDYKLTDDNLLYASFSRGYKGGGFNPPISPAIASFGVKSTFEPEFINAYEVGSKNTFMDGRMQANFTGFYYDYKGYQIGRGVARTVVNENVDATIYGAEGEFLWSPVDPLQLNMTLSYLHTEVKNARAVDARDLTNGQAGHIIIKDLQGENCLLPNTTPAQFSAATDSLVPGPGGIPTVAVPGLLSPGAIVAPLTCAQLALFGLNPTGGIEADLSGNELPLSPQFSVSLGAQYTWSLPGDRSFVARTDYRWQDETWASLYNRAAMDKIETWQTWNAQFTYSGAADRYYVRAYVQNILNDDNITAKFIGAASTGLGTAVALLDPRTFGVELGFHY